MDGCLVGWLCWLVDQSLRRRIIWTIGHLVSCLLVGGMVGWLVVGPVFGQRVDWLLDPKFGCLVGQAMNDSPWMLYPPRKKSCPHCTGGWLDPRAS